MSRKTVLIIKHGFSETCDRAVSRVVSYGDVFRCTCLLEVFRGASVTWITAAAAKDLLEGNHLIDQLILADRPEDIPAGQLRDYYDEVINLEKPAAWRRFAAEMKGGTHYGFKDCEDEYADAFYPASAKALASGLDRSTFTTLQDTLFQTVGRQWCGEHYVMGRQPLNVEIYDVGLNCHVGSKWPTKGWPMERWQQLHDLLIDKGYSVCWQQSLNSVRQYIEWLNSCRLLVTSDSLGLHLGIGLRKKLVALFGPTPAEQVYMYGLGMKLTPTCDRACVPCFQAQCDYDDCCMEHISVADAVEAVEMLLTPKRARQTRQDAEVFAAVQR